MNDFVDLRRRNFIVRCCQGVSAAVVPARLKGLFLFRGPSISPQAAIPPSGELHFHPHYRAQMPLDALLMKTRTGLDKFVTEKYQDQIARILEEWSMSFSGSLQDTRAIEKALASDFVGSSLRPAESKALRSALELEVRKNRFTSETALGREAFMDELRSTLSSFSRILTAEFQVVSIEATPPQQSNNLTTRIRYELVGNGRDCFREQRVGHWDLEWEGNSAGEFRAKNWRWLEETLSRATGPVFVDVSAQAFGGQSAYSLQLLRGVDYWRTVLDGACGIDVYGHNGVSVGDFDGDGFDDLYVCQPAGVPNRLYRNRRDGTFEDITEASGVGIIENTACALFVDVDNDGQQDLIVVRTNGPLLFLNQGGGKFRQKPNAFQFASPPQGTFTGAAVADYDHDGWLDIYFCLYIYYQGTDQYKYPSPYYDAENGPPNFMMRNHRDGTFHDVTAQSGLNQNNTRYSFCCGWNDYNRDGWPDLYVVNDFGRKNLYRNNGDGTFTDVAAQAGVEDIGAGMSVCWFDYDNDGAEDIYVADMWSAAGNRVAMQDVFQKGAPEEIRALYRKHARGNSLFRNIGEGGFQDTSAAAGVEMGRWSWSSDAWDFDHDGFPDLYIANGMLSGPVHPSQADDLNSFFWRQVIANSPTESKPAHDYEQGWNALNELIRSDGTWSGFERNVFYANNRDGTFSDVSGAVGLDFIEDGRAFALADFDHDGRLEVFLKSRNAPQLRLLKNMMKELPPSIAFCLRGVKSNCDAIGAVVTVDTESGRQCRTLQAGSGFLSQHSKEVFFGLGAAKHPVRASIHWPSGAVQELRDLPLNHRIWVEEGKEPPRIEAFTPNPQGVKPAGRSGKAEAVPFPRAIPGTSYGERGGDALPDCIETWLLAPVSAPDFSLPDLAGETRTLTALHGKLVFLTFWAAGSAGCWDGLKVLNQVKKRSGTRGLEVLGVNVDDSAGAEKARALARELNLSFPILQGSDDVAGIYNVLYRYLFDRHRDLPLPISFLIDEKGDIVKVYQGWLDAERVGEDMQHIPRSSKDRMAKALPFPGVSDEFVVQRNYLSYGSVFFQRGYLDQAEASFRLALRDDPSSAEALYGLGSVYLKQQKNSEARTSFEDAIKLHASYPETLPAAWNNLGLIATREGRTADAIPCFQEALRLSPDYLIALDNLGNAYRQQKQWQESRRVLERAVAVGPEDAEANYSLGMVFAQSDDTERAFEYLEQALRIRPEYPEALNNLGVLYLRTRRRDEAVATFEKCIQVAPAFDQSYLNLARVYALEDTRDKAKAVLKELLKQHPEHVLGKQMLEELNR